MSIVVRDPVRALMTHLDWPLFAMSHEALKPSISELIPFCASLR